MDSGGYERFSSIRLLVGLNVDSLVFELERTNADISRLNDANKAKFTQAFSKAQQKSIQKESYQLQVEKSLQALQHALESNLLQIRIVREKNAHAKFYLFYKQQYSSVKNRDECIGSLIVGSSNLSHNGLENNYEFNLKTTDSRDLDFAKWEFESLWESAIPLDSSDIERAKRGTYLEKILSPKEMYHKLLLCHFGEVFLHTDSSIQALIASANYTPYDYQIHAVQEGIDKLERYNGFFLSDVVGLGKTLIACIIAKKLQTDSKITGRILICAPNAVQKSWEKHTSDFKIPAKITTHDSLHKLEDKESFELIIIDESHNFRTTTASRYAELQTLCKIPYTSPSGQTLPTRKRVILLSATPQNNSPKDLEQQIYLFRDKRDTAIVESQSLERFFKAINEQFDKLNKERKELNRKRNEDLANAKKPTTKEAESKNTQALQDLSDTLRDKLLAKIMIRRTRGDIQSSYANDKTKQGLHFPKITDPKPLEYDLDSISHNLATQTLLFLASELNDIAQPQAGEKNGYTYARYLIYPNLTEQGKQKFRAAYKATGKDDRFYKDQSAQLAIFMQKILFKRFDSSIKAFKDTLDKQIHSYTQMLEQFQTDTIYLPKHYDNRERLYRLLEEDNNKALEELLEQDKLLALAPSDFHKDYAQKLQTDRANLQALLDKWEQITQDPKLDKLKAFLDSQEPTQKVVIFTEAKSSSEYLYTQLESTHLRSQILHIHSGNRDELESSIRANFDANYPKDKQQNTKRVIITTDVLAEGINLHRANIIINYDTPYNATRLMQRIGRINRIGTPHKQIHIYNFKPTHFNDHIININAIASQKIQSFHYTLGEDSAIYDESEEFDSKKLFEIVRAKEKETSKDTEYQNDLRDLYFNDKAEFARIKALPSKSRCFIQLDSSTQSYAYLKRDAKSFAPYHIADTNTLLKEAAPKPCLFYDIADFLKAHITHKPYKPSSDELALHHAHTQAALDDYAKPSSPTLPFGSSTSSPSSPNLNPQEKNALHKLRHTELESSLKDSLITALHNGTYHHLAKDINNAKSLEDFKNLAHKYGFTSQSDEPINEPRESTELAKPEIELSITAFAKVK